MSVRCDLHPNAGHEPWQCPGAMTDLERVRKALALFEGIAVPDWDTAKEMATARADIDAHLKEDAKREAQRVQHEQALINGQARLRAELTELRATLGQYKQDAKEADAHIAELTELREAVRAMLNTAYANSSRRKNEADRPRQWGYGRKP